MSRDREYREEAIDMATLFIFSAKFDNESEDYFVDDATQYELSIIFGAVEEDQRAEVWVDFIELLKRANMDPNRSQFQTVN